MTMWSSLRYGSSQYSRLMLKMCARISCAFKRSCVQLHHSCLSDKVEEYPFPYHTRYVMQTKISMDVANITFKQHRLSSNLLFALLFELCLNPTLITALPRSDTGTKMRVTVHKIKTPQSIKE